MNIYCEFGEQNLSNKNLKITNLKNFNTTKSTLIVDCKSDEHFFNKECGKYISFVCEDFNVFDNCSYNYIAELICNQLDKFLLEFNLTKNFSVLIVGLGNMQISADSLGNKVCNRIILSNTKTSLFNNNIYCFTPSVFSKTNLKTADIIKNICNYLTPDVVILIDSLTCNNYQVLGKSFQISNAGLTPGEDFLVNTTKINYNFLKIPVISIGCPTVVNIKKILKQNCDDLFLTLKDIEAYTDKFAYIIALAINNCLNKNLTKNDIKFFMS